MDNQSDSVWIEPLEATALSIDEETKTQTPVSVEDAMNLPRSEFVYNVLDGDAAYHSGWK